MSELQEKKFILQKEKYSVGEDGMIHLKEILPLTNIIYELALELQAKEAHIEEGNMIIRKGLDFAERQDIEIKALKKQNQQVSRLLNTL